MDNVLQKFEDEGLLRHFMLFLEGIASDQLATSNISILLTMEMAMLQSLNTTTQMRYRNDTCLFWETVLAIGGPRLLRLFSSDKHFGKVNSNECERSKYNPQQGSFNFAVPDERVLRKSKTFVEKEIPCGFIEDSLQFLDPSKQYIISFDGKQTGVGLKNEGEGDVNLWGFEGPPTLDDMRRSKAFSVDFISDVAACASEDETQLKYGSVVHKLKVIVQRNTKRIRNLRQGIVRHEILRSTFNKTIMKHPDKGSKYHLAFADIEVFISRAEKVISDLLAVNKEWCAVMAMINRNDQYFQMDRSIDVSRQGNLLQLLQPNVINELRPNFLPSKPQFVKQRTPEWHRLRSRAMVTGSTMHNAIGLRTLKDQKDHFDKFVLHKVFADQPTPAMVHGTNFEVNFT